MIRFAVLTSLALLVPGTAQAHLSMSWWQGVAGTSWLENGIELTGLHTTDGGQTTSSAAFAIGNWVQGGDYLETDATTANWQEFTVLNYPNFAPLSLNIAAKTGVQELYSSTGASVTITGSVGSTFTFPATPDWANLTWFAVYTVSGSIGIDDVLLSVCPQPIIAGPYSVNEGSGVLLGASVEGSTPTYDWDLDEDGQYDDATSQTPLFSAANLDGPHTITLGLQASADCGSAGINTMTDDDTVTVLNVAPTITPPTTPTSANEGDALSWTMSFADPGIADTHTILWDFDDGATQSGGLTGTHTYVDDGSFGLEISVTDDDGGTDLQTLLITVANVAPTIDSATFPSGDEGDALTFTSSASDAGTTDVLTYSWDFGDGSGNHLGATHGHSYPQDGTYAVTLTVTDGDGGVATQTQNVVIADVAPTIDTFTVPPTTSEGTAISVIGAAIDPGADTLTLTWSWGDGTASTTGTTASHTFTDEGVFAVTLTVSDQAGVTVSQTTNVTVSNVVPVISGYSIPSGPEGSVLTFAATIVDPGNDTINAVWTLGDGTTLTGATVTHAYVDEGTFAVSLAVDDGDGGTASISGTAAAFNVAPTIDALTGNSTGPEGVALSWTATITDPGTSDVISYAWSFGDGATATGGPTQSHSYIGVGSYTVVLTVDDGDGGSNSALLTVTIANGIPLITSMTTTNGDEGQPLAFTATATDPSNELLTYTWDFGDGSPTGSGAAVSHTYVDDGTFPVLLTVTDPQAATATQSDTVTIANVAPTLMPLVGPLVGTEGTSETWSAAATDPGTSDSLTIAWHWGDGTPDGSSTGVAHTYADDGTYTLTATATDGDGGSDTETLQVVISNVAPAFASAGTTTADEGVPYSWTPSVTEPGPDVLAFSLVGPAAMTLDSATGELQWTPSYADATSGPHAVSLTVDDGDGGTAMVAWNIDVVATDADGDGLPDGWEIANNLDPTSAADATADDDGDGLTNLDEFAGGTDPASYDGPSAPTLVDPLDEGEAGARPELVLLGATDPQGDALTLTLEVYSDFALTTLAAGASMAQVEGENRWIVDVDLPENADVWWRARAADAAADGPWSDVWQLFINGTEEAPPTPTALYPVDDEVVSNSFPHVEWAEVEDADRDPVHYLVEVAEVAGAVVASVVDWPAGEEAFLTWDIDAELTEDGRYEWRVAAADDTGLQSDWSEPEPFLYSRANAAPEGIAWVTPANGAEIDERSPLLAATEGWDVEGDTIGYLFEFSGTSTFDDATYTGQELPATGTGQVSWDLAAEGLELPWGDVFARVRGVDGAGASSPPDSVSFFVLGGPEPTPEPTPTDTCADCGSSIGSESGMEFSLAVLACMVIFVIVRRHRTPATQEPTQ